MKLPKARKTTIPSDQCYWALLKGTGAGGLRGSRKREALLYELERYIPVPIESVAVSFVPCQDRIIACAAPLRVIEEFRLTSDSVIPDALPKGLDAGTLNRTSFELLSGPTKPKRQERFERLRLICIASLAILASAALTKGFVVRTGQVSTQTAQLKDQIENAYGYAIDLSAPSTQPPHVRLVSAVRDAEANAASAPAETRLEDALPLLLHILSHWPESDSLGLNRLTIGNTEATLDLSLDTSTDASDVLEALGAPDGWLSRSPRIRQQRDGQSVLITFVPESLREQRR